jgi:parallel beta-helix repeat protein
MNSLPLNSPAQRKKYLLTHPVRPASRTLLGVHQLEDRVTPATYTVTNTGDTGAGTGTTGDLRYCIGQANAAAGADQIVFSLPAGPQTINLLSALPALTDNLTITGPGASLLTVQRSPSAATSFRVFTLNISGIGNVTLSGMTISGGNAGIGAGINAANANLTVTDCVITGNTTTSVGGGIYLAFNAGLLKVVNTTISGNSALRGGGIYFFENGSMDLRNSTVSGNTTSSTGGGIYFFGAVGSGGFAITNSTIHGNTAGSTGGGLFLNALTGTATVQNSTVTGNTSNGGNGGGGIAKNTASGTLNLVSTVVAGNTNAAAPDVFSSGGAVTANNTFFGSAQGLTVSGSGNFTSGTNAAPLNPQLGPLQDNGGPTLTRAPLTGSPLLDAGSNPAGLPNDQRGVGFVRVFGPAADIGAVEVQPPLPFVQVVSAPDVSTGGGTSYTFTVTYVARSPNLIDFSSLGTGDVTVSGPGGFTTTPAFVSATPNVNSGTIVATYTFTPPGGSWNPLDNGAYSISVVAGQVADTAAQTVPPAPYGSFQVSISKIFTVTNTNDSGTGSLRQAVLDANAFPGADIIVFSSLFNTPQTITLTSDQIAITDPVTITGPGANKLTVTRASSAPDFRIFQSTAPSLTITGMKISNGNAVGGGGLKANNVVVLDSVVFTGNTSTGTALHDGGGAIQIDTGGTLTVRNSTISGNTAENDGAGIYFYFNGSLTVQNSTISGNTTTNPGVNYLGGGGIYFFGSASTFLIQNSTIAGNTSASSGGGIQLTSFAGTLTVQNSTITGNSATGQGGGIASYLGGGTITVVSSVVSGNDNTSGPDIFSSGTVNVNFSAIGSATGFTPSGSSGNNLAYGIDLKLGPLANNGGPTMTIAPLAGSPLINAGSNPAGLTTDQRGPSFVRVFGTQADIGAFEVQPPSVFSITTPTPSPTNATALTFTVTFNGPVAGVTAANFALTTTGGVAGTIGTVTGSGTTWTVPVTGITGTGTLRLDLANATGITPGVAVVPYTGGPVVAIDHTAPTVQAITLLDPSPAVGATARFQVTFSEPVTGVTLSNFALYTAGVVSGYSLSSVSGSGTTWTVTINVGTGNGAVGLTVQNTTGVSDLAGNPLAGLPVNGPFYAIGSPVVFSITGPVATNAFSFTYTVTFTQSVTGGAIPNFQLVTGGLVTGASITNVTGSGSTRTVTINAGTGEGTIQLNMVNGTLVLPALFGLPFNGQVVTIDRTPPQVSSITQVGPTLTNAASVQYTVIFSEAVIGLTTGNFTALSGNGLSGASVTNVSGSGTTWTVTVNTGTGDGTVQLVLTNNGNGGLTDLAGNPLVGLPVSGPIVNIDKTPPTVQPPVLTGPTPTNAGTVQYTVTFSESVVGLSPNDFSVVATGGVTGAGVTNVTGGGATWTVTVNTGSGDGTVQLVLANSGGLSDLAGNPVAGLPVAGDTVTIDKTPPVVQSIALVGPPFTNGTTAQYTVTFSEPIIGLTKDNFTLATTGTIAGATITNLTGGGSTYTLTVDAGTGEGTIRLDLSNTAGLHDAAGNPLAGPFDGQVVTIDRTDPVGLTTVPAGANPTNSATAQFTVTFSEVVTGVTVGNFAVVTTGTISGAAVTTMTGSGATYTVTVITGLGDGTIRLVLATPSGVQDLAGNPLAGQPFDATALEIDKTFPTIQSIARLSANPSNAAAVQYTVTFSEVVRGVTPAAFSVLATGGLTGAGVTVVTTTDGRVYTVTVATGTGDGTVRLDLVNPAGIVDRVGQPLTARLTGATFTIDKTPPRVTINRAAGQADVSGLLPIQFTVVFTEPVTGFGADDVVVTGTAGPGHVTVTGSGTTYTVLIDGLSETGTVTATVRDAAAADAAGNPSLPSTSTDNTVTFVLTAGAVPDSYATRALTPLAVPAPGVLANDADPEGRPLTAVLVSGPPANVGSVVLNPDGSFVFRPAPGFLGTAKFSYQTFNGLAVGAPADVTIVVTPRITLSAAGAGAGGGPQVTVYNQDGTVRFNFFAYEPTFTGGVYVATGDINGDGVDDIITGAGIGGGPLVRAFDGVTGAQILNFFAYDPSVRGGVSVAVGDVDGDGFPDLVTGAGPGGGPHVKVFSAAGVEKFGFFAYAPTFTGGVTVSTGDINGDGVDEIAVGAGPGGGPHVQVFDARTQKPLLSFFAFDPKSRGGVSVAIGDAYADGTADVFAGSGTNGVVRVFSGGLNGVRLTAVDITDPFPAQSVRVATSDTNGDGVGDRLLVATGPGTPPMVRRYNLANFAVIDDLVTFPQDFLGGLYVG